MAIHRDSTGEAIMTNYIAAPSSVDDLTDSRDDFRNAILKGLSRPQKSTPCKYLYDEAGSRIFDRICRLDEYYLTRAEVSILRLHGAEMAAAVGTGCDLIELGSGSSLKTRLLLKKLKQPRRYYPVDISRTHLERYARRIAARFPGLAVRPIHADFTAPFRIPTIRGSLTRRVVYFPGSTIGNFTPDEASALLRSISRLVGPGGGLLIGFDVKKDASILLPAYNDGEGVTAEFNLNLLTRINRELDGDFDLDSFGHKAIYDPENERVEMHLVSLRAQVAHLPGAEFRFRRGETILTEYSHKYSFATFDRLTAEAGFAQEGQWMDENRLFCVRFLTA